MDKNASFDDVILRYAGKSWSQIVEGLPKPVAGEDYCHTLKKFAYADTVKDRPLTEQLVHQIYYHPIEVYMFSDGWQNPDRIESTRRYCNSPDFINNSWPCLLPLEHNLSSAAKILDYGSGDGAISMHLRLRGYSDVTIADLATPTIQILREFIRRELDIKFSFLDHPAENPELGLVLLPPESFDYIVCSEVLEHCFDPIATLRHVISLLKPGGLLYLSTFFNCLKGLDPTHLHHNCIYQDHDLWFRIVEALGLKHVWNCRAGTKKGFVKHNA